MMKRAYAIGLLGAVLGASTILVVACGSSDPAPTGGVTADTGSGGGDTGSGSETPTIDSGIGGDTGTAGETSDDTGTAGEGGADAGCGATPTLHPPSADAGPDANPGVFCPFSAPAGGKNVTCAAGQSCCETPKKAGTPSTCVATGTSTPTACPVTGSLVWDCEGPANCGTGTVCCAAATSIATDVTCGYDKATGFKGTTCKTACAASGEFQICEAAGDCPTGKTCTAMKAAGNQVGYCK